MIRSMPRLGSRHSVIAAWLAPSYSITTVCSPASAWKLYVLPAAATAAPSTVTVTPSALSRENDTMPPTGRVRASLRLSPFDSDTWPSAFVTTSGVATSTASWSGFFVSACVKSPRRSYSPGPMSIWPL